MSYDPYPRQLTNELYEIKDASTVFAYLTNPDNYKHDLYWNDIIKKIKIYYDVHDSGNGFRKYITSAKDFSWLENTGLDYNYKDSFGNNFLHYALGTKEENDIHNTVNFASDAAMEYIISKTDDVYYIPNNGKNILFYYLSLSQAGKENAKFMNLLDRYPDFNLEQRDSYKCDLLYRAISKGNMGVANVLLERGVSITNINEQGKNILDAFMLIAPQPAHFELFDMLLKKVDISHTGLRNESLISTWLEWSADTTMNQPEFYQKWLRHTMKKICEEQFYYDETSLGRLRDIFETSGKIYVKNGVSNPNYEKTSQLIDLTVKTLNYIELDINVPKTPGISRRSKI